MNSREAREKSEYIADSDRKDIDNACSLFETICLNKIYKSIEESCDSGKYFTNFNYANTEKLVMYKNSCYIPIYGKIENKRCDILSKELEKSFSNVIKYLRDKKFYVRNTPSIYSKKFIIEWDKEYHYYNDDDDEYIG